MDEGASSDEHVSSDEQDVAFDYGRHWATGIEPYDPTLQKYTRECLPGGPTYNLCEICRNIDFDAIKDIQMETVPRLRSVVVPVFLFPKGLDWLDSSCPFCRLMDPYVQAWVEKGASPSQIGWQIGLRTIWTTKGQTTALVFDGSGSHGDSSVRLLGVRNEVLLYSVAPGVGKECALKSHRYLNASWLRGELEICQSSHDNGTSRTAIPGLRLLDCTTMTVVSAPDNAEYLALSYVWSKPRSWFAASSSEPIPVPAAMSPTIDDAARLALRLGKDFLWVDRLCIDQHNLAQQRQQIASMAHIYRGACATIVMLDGDDSRPLPGVSTPFADCRFARVRDGIIAARGLLPNTVQNSAWHGRGWTFQEAYLSTRIIYISASGVILSCPKLVLEELPPEVDLAAFPTLSWDVPGDRLVFDVGSAYPWDFGKIEKFDLFSIYVQRSLTYESDALDAFRGYLDSCGLWSYWGIPMLGQKEHLRIFTNPTCLFEASIHALGFCVGLSWSHSKSSSKRAYAGIEHRLTRLQTCPSWSWVVARLGARYKEDSIPTRQSIVLSQISIMKDAGLESIETFFCQRGSPGLVPEESLCLQFEGPLLPITRTADSRSTDYSHEVSFPDFGPSKTMWWFSHLGYSDHGDTDDKEERAAWALPVWAGIRGLTQWNYWQNKVYCKWVVFWLEIVERNGVWQRSGLITSQVEVVSDSFRPGTGPPPPRAGKNFGSSRGTDAYQQQGPLGPEWKPFGQKQEPVEQGRIPFANGVGVAHAATRETLAQEFSRFPTQTVILA